MKPVLDGTVALVTGASSGIGAATAAALAAQGAAVALAARRKDRLEALATDIRDQGGTALVLECDITNEQQAAAAVEHTVSRLGRLDTLINNAGVMLLGPVADAPLPEWQQMVQLNVLGVLYCAHAALPHLLRAAADGPRQVADMVNISSVAGRAARHQARPSDQPVHSFTTLLADLGTICLNTIAPADPQLPARHRAHRSPAAGIRAARHQPPPRGRVVSTPARTSRKPR